MHSFVKQGGTESPVVPNTTHYTFHHTHISRNGMEYQEMTGLKGHCELNRCRGKSRAWREYD
jgi:hypothetical protein